MKQKNVIVVKMTGFGENKLAICKRCNEADTKHEIEYPSKRSILKNDKKVVVCEGFQSFVMPDQPNVELVSQVPISK